MPVTKPLPMVFVFALIAGCNCDDNTTLDGGPDPDGGAIDGGGPIDGSGPMDGSTTDAGPGIIIVDGGLLLPDGNIIPFGPIPCQGHIYQCGDEIDNDGDGVADAADPDCLGPCDNNEMGFYLGIPGGDSAPCRLDCYFDQDQGSGNDGCEWDHRCDPLEPDLNPMCAYLDPPPPSARCPDTQDPECAEFCGPLVPNGCDCFGCCNLPSGTDRWVFIGSVDGSGNATCTLDEVENDANCHPCTPVPGCLNSCGMCELCLGRPTLPPECLPGPADAGPPPDGGFPDAGPVDGGVPMPVCTDGRTSCGVPGLPPCPASYFCLTGCCTFFG